MLKTRVMPCLLLRGRALVKTIKFKNPSYVGDPINTVRIYNEKEVDELIFLDITATASGKEPPYDLLEEIASECFMPFTYGGGIRTLDQMRRIFNLGVEKVAINSHAAERPTLIRDAAEAFGSQSVVVSIDVKKKLFGRYEVYARGGKQALHKDPVTYAREMEQLGAGEILLTAIDRDGTMDGYDLDDADSFTGKLAVLWQPSDDFSAHAQVFVDQHFALFTFVFREQHARERERVGLVDAARSGTSGSTFLNDADRVDHDRQCHGNLQRNQYEACFVAEHRSPDRSNVHY